MSSNAYLDVNLNDTDWYDLGSSWQTNTSFGWDSNGIRGYVFANEDNSLLVISIKGANVGLWSGGPTAEKDKSNTNILFSCCCARISRAWTPVCDCYKDNEYICESSCLQKKISESELYYDNALSIYKEVHRTYPKGIIWMTGHSVGGALASLVGQTFGIPTVTFETPGDRLASQRLHLPHNYQDLPIWHFGHTADPIFTGDCVGFTSSCWYVGYAMESKCHTGKMCVWDTVKNNGWSVDINSHRIKNVIEKILMNPEDFPLPDCVVEEGCSDYPYPLTEDTHALRSRNSKFAQNKFTATKLSGG
ncbi:hypothetical protein G6F43_006274 [Rhizopus delemar]|nr:hypothetical protein G6F43_006274 [Rhizopus delemar]